MVDDLFRRIMEERDRLGDAVSNSDIFTRQFGSELAAWELRFQRDFREHVAGRIYKHRGFVHYTRDPSLLMLTPSPWLIDGVFIYLYSDQEPPPEGAYVEITGPRVVSPTHLQRNESVFEAFAADSIEVLPLDYVKDIRPPLSLKELSGMLFERVGMAEASKQVFTMLFVSSPPFERAVGGLTAGVRAFTSKTKLKRLMIFMRRILPPTLRGQWRNYRTVRGVAVSTPRIWRLDAGSIPLSRLRALCLDRRDPSGFKEVSVGALTTDVTAALPDVPMALTSDDFWVETKNAEEIRLPLLKSAITFQMLTPSVSRRTVDSAAAHITQRLEHLCDSFGLEQTELMRGRILDADILGRPLSTLRLARSAARSKWTPKVGLRDLKRTWDRMLEPAIKEFLEVTRWAEEAKHWDVPEQVSEISSKILRALEQLDSDDSSIGVTADEICILTSLPRHKVLAELDKMKNMGVAYEPRLGEYKLVR